jgi:hypothetical protein
VGLRSGGLQIWQTIVLPGISQAGIDTDWYDFSNARVHRLSWQATLCEKRHEFSWRYQGPKD